MSDKVYYSGWSTQNEIDHLDGLLVGKWTGRPPKNPEKLLRSYIRGVKYRILYNTWGLVDGREVLKHAISKVDNAV